MKKNRDIVYEYLWKESIATGKTSWKTDEVAEALNMQRTNVSTLLNELTTEGLLIKSKTRPVLYKVASRTPDTVERKPFEELVGFDGSLKKAVDDVKKALMYPADSLNIQVVTDAGSGSTAFCNDIYYYGLMMGKFGKNSPFIYVNCRHFNKNRSALNDVIFGDESGIEKSAFYQAMGGVLFIDHIELLEPEQYSRISGFLETGRIDSSVDKRTEYIKNLVFVFTMTSWDDEQVDWRNTVSIPLPRLNDRPMKEIFKLIKNFFEKEAENSGCQIKVDVDAMRILMNVEYPHGIKTMVNGIKSACANAYIKLLDEEGKTMYVTGQDLPEDVQANFRPIGAIGAQIDSIIGTANYFSFGDKSSDEGEIEATEVYGQLKNQYQGMIDKGISADEIKKVIGSYLDNICFDMPKNLISGSNINIGQLAQIVDTNVINYVSLFAERYKHDYGKELSDSMFCGLCLHINSILKKDKISPKRIDDDQVRAIITHYPKEYATMLDFTHVLYERFFLKFSIEEVAILTMYLIDTKESDDSPVLLYAMHGKGVASGLAEVANTTTKENNAFALELDVNEDTAATNLALEQRIKEVNQGGGVVVIYDSSSMEVMLDSIAERCNIKIRGMNIPITTIGVVASRNCKKENDIDKAYHGIRKSMNHMYYEYKRPMAIVTLCHTSEGGAEQLKNYISRYSKLEMPIFALSMGNKDKLIKEVIEIKKSYRIHAFVGTFDPEIFGIPFISIADVFECSKEDLDHVLMFETVQRKYMGYEKVIDNYGREAKYLTAEKLRKYVPDTVEKLAVAYDLDADERVGLCAHIVYMLDVLSSPNYKIKGINNSKYFADNPTDYKVISNYLKALEKNFHVIISDEEVATLMRILKKER